MTDEQVRNWNEYLRRCGGADAAYDILHGLYSLGIDHVTLSKVAAFVRQVCDQQHEDSMSAFERYTLKTG